MRIEQTGRGVSDVPRILADVAETHAHRADERRASRVILRLSVDGRDQGRLRSRCVVEEDDRIKLYGADAIIHQDAIAAVDALKSDAGRTFGARVTTADGRVVAITTAPGMRKRRRRSM